MSSKISYEEALSNLTAILSEREKELNDREEKLKQVEAKIESDRQAIYGDTNPSDVLSLNVGGALTTVSRRILTCVPGSMLASMFSGRWDDRFEMDKDGNIFIEQESSLFFPMIAYLRNKQNGTERYPVRSPQIGEDFYRMMDYYGMTDAIYPIYFGFFAGSDDFEVINPRKVNAKEWTTFELKLDGHVRRVKSFEVTLGNVQRIQIGWKYRSITLNGSSGVGDVSYSFALDLTRSSYLCEGSSIPIENIEHQEGTVVTSERYGKTWRINGEDVASVSASNWDQNEYSSVESKCVPLISVKGEVEITSVEFCD